MRTIPVFFYGLFMDEELLRSKGLHPSNARAASVAGFAVRIGRRATIVPEAGGRVHGVVFELPREEIDALYSDASVSMYRPEAVLCETSEGATVAALCFTLLDEPSAEERNAEYAAKLRELARRLQLPAHYVDSIKSS